MSYTRLHGVSFGKSKTGLAGTCSYHLYDAAGSSAGSDITAGITERSPGYYAATIAFTDTFTGEVRWYDGSSTYVSEFINPSDGEWIDQKLSSIASSVGTGAHSVTVTVTDGVNPVASARVQLREGVNTYTALTNVSGVATFALDSATYSLGITKGGYEFTPVTVIVTADANFNEVITATVIPAAPADPNMCAVYGTFSDLVGVSDLTTVKFTFILQVQGPAKAGKILVPRTVTGGLNASGQLIDSSGALYVNLARNDDITPAGSQYHVVSKEAHLDHRLTLNAATFDLASLIE